MNVEIKKIENVAEKKQYLEEGVLLHGSLDNTISENIFEKEYWAAFVEDKFVGCIIGKIEHWGPNEDDYYENHKLSHLDVNEHNNGKLIVCYILPEYRRKGIGEKLFQTMEKYFQENNCQYILGIHQDSFWSDDSEEKQFFRHIGLVNITRSYVIDNYFGDDNDFHFSIMVKYIGKI